MARSARTLILAAIVLAGLGSPASSQMSRGQYEAFIRSEIAKCVAESTRLDKEAGMLNHPTAPTRQQREASCKEMLMQVHDLYPETEQPKKRR